MKVHISLMHLDLKELIADGNPFALQRTEKIDFKLKGRHELKS
jgi:hypothetical protein